MSTTIYYHESPQSVESKLIQFFMGLFGMKRAMEKKIVNNSYNKEPATVPKSLRTKYTVEVEESAGRKVWTLFPAGSETDTVLLFLHGGAFYANITPMHWHFVEQLLAGTGSRVIVPDYPLVPGATCTEIYQFIETVYLHQVSLYPSKQLVIMGDSSGGGLALGFAREIRNKSVKQPDQIMLFSPWLDVSMTNPAIAAFDKSDKILSINGLVLAGKKYAGDLDVTDSRVSPIYGDFSDMARISVFIGTNDVFIADARKLKHLLADQPIDLNYFEYPGMFHDWILVSNLPEAKDVISKIANCL